MNLWKRFTTWLNSKRHPSFTVRFGNSHAEDVPCTYSSVPDMSEWPPISNRKVTAEEVQNALNRLKSDPTPIVFNEPLTPQEARRIAIERWRNPFAKEEIDE